MTRLTNLTTNLAMNAGKYRVVLQLGLLAVGLLAMALGGGAPDCYDPGGSDC